MSTRAAGSPVAPPVSNDHGSPLVSVMKKGARFVPDGWLAAHAIGALRLAQLGAGAGVGEGDEPTPALERADVPTRIRAGRGELVEVAGHRDGLAVELARPQQLDQRWQR